jgi:hypothetical protein
MNDTLLLTVGLAAFGLMFVGIVLTILEFRSLPRWQSPEYKSVAAQAQPRPAQPRDEGN